MKDIYSYELYKEKLTAVRQSTKSNPDHESRKQEVAKFRKELLADWAYFLMDEVNFHHERPQSVWHNAEKKKEQETRMLGNPHLAEAFQQEMAKRHTNVINVIKFYCTKLGIETDTFDVRKWKEEDRYTVGKEIYRLTAGKEPIGKVQIVYSPYALTIDIEDRQDYILLAPTEKAAGHFVTPNRIFSPLSFSSIFLNGLDGLEHEEDHNVHDALVTVLHKERKESLVWEKEAVRIFFSSYENLNQLRAGLLDVGITQAITQLKDELLVQMQPVSHFTTETFATQHNTYDYISWLFLEMEDQLSFPLSLEEKENLMNEVWTAYQQKIAPAVEAIEKLVERYTRFGQLDRLKYRNYVLKLVPMEKWPEMLHELETEEAAEMEKLREAQDHLMKTSQRIFIAKVLVGKEWKVFFSEHPKKKMMEIGKLNLQLAHQYTKIFPTEPFFFWNPRIAQWNKQKKDVTLEDLTFLVQSYEAKLRELMGQELYDALPAYYLEYKMKKAIPEFPKHDYGRKRVKRREEVEEEVDEDNEKP
jgi:hypothetical protein